MATTSLCPGCNRYALEEARPSADRYLCTNCGARYTLEDLMDA